MTKIHENPHLKPFQCPGCDKAFKDSGTKIRHLRTLHPDLWRETSGASQN